MRAEDFAKPAVPTAYALLILQLAAERGASREALLADAGIPAASLQAADSRLTQIQIGRLMFRALQLTGDDALGYEIGLRSNLTSHGFVGYGLLSHATVRQALDFGAKFVKLRTPFLGIKYFSEKDQGVIEVYENVPFGPLRRCTFDLFLVGIARIAQQMTAGQLQTLRDIELWFDYPEPDYYPRYRERLPPARFCMAANQMRFPAALLDRRMMASDPTTAKLVTDQLEREYTLLGYSGDFLARVRAVVVNEKGGYPDLEAACARLHMSTRTLKRRLQQHGLSFQKLLDDVRRRDSMRLLDDPTLSVEEVARRIGYTDPANFTRAFRKWSGASPSAYRSRERLNPARPAP